MDNLLHRDRDDQLDEGHAERGDREITLGTTMILAIFFALAVFAAVFFGFGYSMGSRRAAASPPGASTSVAGTPVTGAAKPAAGSPAGAQSSSASARSLREPAPAAASDSSESKHSQPVSSAAAGPALAAAAQPVVQVAAVSHKEDADLLVSTLKARGYAVGIHTYPHDPLLHVQVGPFATHQEADDMRKRLIADGFNAIVKEPGR